MKKFFSLWGFFFSVLFVSCDVACMDPQCERLPVLLFEIYEDDLPISEVNFKEGNVSVVGIKDDNLKQDFYFFPIDQEKGYYSIEPSIQFDKYAIFYQQLFQDTISFEYKLITTECCDFSPVLDSYQYRNQSVTHQLGGIIPISFR